MSKTKEQKENINKLLEFKWKDEIFWIVFFILLFFSVWAYKEDIATCEPYVRDPCGMCKNLTLHQIGMKETYSNTPLNVSLNISKNGTG